MIKKLRQFDNYIASTVIYRTIDAICNYLLGFCAVCVFIMALKQVVQIYLALGN